jgi:outer membrane protein
MKLHKLTLLPFAIAVWMATHSVAAQESLIAIYERALQNDPALREAEANYLATAEARPQARSGLLPSLQLSSTNARSDSENPNPPLDFQTGQPSQVISSTESTRDQRNLSLSLNQSIFDWSRYVSLRQADKVVARAETDFAAAQQDLLLRVADTYFNVLAAEDTLASAVAARESIARQLEQAERRFEVGLIAITDVQETQAGFDTAVADEIAAQRALATAQEFLREIIGEYVTDLAGPTDELPLLNPDPANPEQWVNTAMQQNLALISSRIGRDIAEDDIKITRAARFPTLDFSTSLNDQTSDLTQTNNFFNLPSSGSSATTVSEGYNWSFNFSVPLYTGGLNRSRIQQNVYRHRVAMEALERIARQTERETRDAYLGVISEISRVQALRQAVQSSQTALRATEAGFDVGTRTSVDVLTSQNNLRRAETTYARSRYDYILNVLRLKQAAGGLSAEDLREVDGWLQ